MPAAGTKKYEVISPPGARSKKGIYTWRPDGKQTENGEPTGDQVRAAVGEMVMLSPEAAAPLVATGHLRPVADA